MNLERDTESRVLEIVRARGLLEAIAFLRSATGANLQDAHAAVLQLASANGLISRHDEDSMGMNAEVLAIGPFHPGISHLLDYGPEHYSTVAEGTEVSVLVIHSLSGSTQSRAVAQALGFDPWNFSSHSFDGSHVSLENLKIALLSSWTDPSPEIATEIDETIRQFITLRGAGFRFLFRPNG